MIGRESSLKCYFRDNLPRYRARQKGLVKVFKCCKNADLPVIRLTQVVVIEFLPPTISEHSINYFEANNSIHQLL